MGQGPLCPRSPPAMAPRGSLLLLALLLLSCALPRGRGQHWSHGWYPGGKRDLRTPTNLQVGCPPRVIPLQVIPFPPGVIPPLPRVMPSPAVSPCPGVTALRQGLCPPLPGVKAPCSWGYNPSGLSPPSYTAPNYPPWIISPRNYVPVPRLSPR